MEQKPTSDRDGHQGQRAKHKEQRKRAARGRQVMAENGDHVTWREFNLVRDAWKREVELIVAPLVEKMDEIGDKLDGKSAFWANAWVLFVASSAGAAIGTGVWFLFG